MKHYVCPGDCGGEAKKPGVCKADGCTHEGEALVACECEDGSHDEALFGGPEKDAFTDSEEV